MKSQLSGSKIAERELPRPVEYKEYSKVRAEYSEGDSAPAAEHSFMTKPRGECKSET